MWVEIEASVPTCDFVVITRLCWLEFIKKEVLGIQYKKPYPVLLHPADELRFGDVGRWDCH